MTTVGYEAVSTQKTDMKRQDYESAKMFVYIQKLKTRTKQHRGCRWLRLILYLNISLYVIDVLNAQFIIEQNDCQFKDQMVLNAGIKTHWCVDKCCLMC